MGRMIFVTNNNDFIHRDRYDGEEFVFPPGEQIAIPEEAAVHMFGRGVADKTATLQRLGWAFEHDPATKQFVDSESGVKKLANFVFNEAKLTPMLPAQELEIA